MSSIAGPWWTEEEADFWLTVEANFVDLYAGSAPGAVALFRGSFGEGVLRGIQRARPQVALDPHALAHAANTFSVAG